MNDVALQGQRQVFPSSELVLDLHQPSPSFTGTFFFHELHTGGTQERNTQPSLQYVLGTSPCPLSDFLASSKIGIYLDLSKLLYIKVQPQLWLLLNKEVGFLFILFPLPAFCHPQAV